MTTKTQFENFLHDIQPSPTTVDQISSAQRALRKYLRQHPKFKDVHLYTFLTGSYARDTAIRPRMFNGSLAKPDVDIIVVTNHTITDKPATVLNSLRSILAEEYELDKAPHTRSVGIKTDTIEMDVVPIIAPPIFWPNPYRSDLTLEDLVGHKLYIPDRTLAEWCETNSPKQLKWACSLNDASKGMFKPIVKLVKWTRRENPTMYKRPKGITLECMVGECIDSQETDYEESFLKTLEGMVSRYAWAIASHQTPWIADPGVPADSVTRTLEPEHFAAFYRKVKDWAEWGRQAQQESNPEKQLSLWRNTFGDRFPAAGGVAKEMLSEPYVPANLSFPDRPTRPRKPGGFAA